VPDGRPGRCDRSRGTRARHGGPGRHLRCQRGFDVAARARSTGTRVPTPRGRRALPGRGRRAVTGIPAARPHAVPTRTTGAGCPARPPARRRGVSTSSMRTSHLPPPARAFEPARQCGDQRARVQGARRRWREATHIGHAGHWQRWPEFWHARSLGAEAWRGAAHPFAGWTHGNQRKTIWRNAYLNLPD